MKRKYLLPIIGLFAILLALVTASCYHRTSEQKAEHVVKHLISTLNLNPEQTAKLEQMKEEFLTRRTEMKKMQKESLSDIEEMMLSPQVNQTRLNTRMEKIQTHTNDMIRFISAKFVELHDMLTPEQRSKLVAEMEEYSGGHHHL